MNFRDLPSTQKGELGESELDKYLLSKGVIPYAPVPAGAHPFDRLCASPDKKRLYVAECKTKARRTFYPDTGIDMRHYRDYRHIRETYGIDILLFFVDESVMEIYGNSLSELEKPVEIIDNGRRLNYPMTQGSIIYFPLMSMTTICNIPVDVAEKMRVLSRRSYSYPVGTIELGAAR